MLYCILDQKQHVFPFVLGSTEWYFVTAASAVPVLFGLCIKLQSLFSPWGGTTSLAKFPPCCSTELVFGQPVFQIMAPRKDNVPNTQHPAVLWGLYWPPDVWHIYIAFSLQCLDSNILCGWICCHIEHQPALSVNYWGLEVLDTTHNLLHLTCCLYAWWDMGPSIVFVRQFSKFTTPHNLYVHNQVYHTNRHLQHKGRKFQEMHVHSAVSTM